MKGTKPTAATFKSLSLAYFFTFIVLLSIGGIFLSRTLIFLNHSEETQGHVVEIIQGKGLRPQVEFTSKDGSTHEFTSHTGSSMLPFEVGDEVTVLYNPENPNHARLDWFPALWLLPILLGGIGGLFLILSLVFLLVGVLMQRKSLTI